MERKLNTGKSLRRMMIVPILLFVASVMTEIGNCHSAQLTIREELNDTITALIRRTKKSLAEANAEIVCNRGESYELRFS